ncbi:MAG: hypothetical protein U9N73_05795 [Candidatus Auribacterota bacterium]|nr:hypothetical protein [Candidatus Auribacterota bacterium]
MELFNTLFGIEAEAVQRSCIIMPFVTKEVLREFGVEELSRGKLYGAGNGEFCTIFHTRMGPSFTGDAVLYLSETACRQLFFLGTCGLLPGTMELKIGSLVSPFLSYAQESFTSLLSGATSIGEGMSSDWLLHGGLISLGEEEDIANVTGISVGSLKLQEEMMVGWREKGIQVVDMESAAFLAAARRIKRPAAVLMAVSDIVGEGLWNGERSREITERSLERGARILCGIISGKQSG